MEDMLKLLLLTLSPSKHIMVTNVMNVPQQFLFFFFQMQNTTFQPLQYSQRRPFLQSSRIMANQYFSYDSTVYMSACELSLKRRPSQIEKYTALKQIHKKYIILTVCMYLNSATLQPRQYIARIRIQAFQSETWAQIIPSPLNFYVTLGWVLRISYLSFFIHKI